MAHSPLKKRKVSQQSGPEIDEAADSGRSPSVPASEAEPSPYLNGDSKHLGQSDSSDGSDAGVQNVEHQTVSEASPSRRDNPRPVLQPSLLGLQCEQLIRNLPPSYHSTGPSVDSFLRRLKRTIECAEPIGPLTFEQAQKSLLKPHEVAAPFCFPRPALDARHQFFFAKPESILHVESSSSTTECHLDGKSSPSLMLTMPSSIFTEKDYMNYRYFQKRAYYLACVSQTLHSSPGWEAKLTFEMQHGNPLSPALLVQQTSGHDDFAHPPITVRITAIPPKGIFPRARLYPVCSCIRSKTKTSQNLPKLSSTPLYNATLSFDIARPEFRKLLHGAAASCAGFRDACLLGQVWLRQRRFYGSIQQGGFGGFEWSVIIALLLQGGASHGGPILSMQYDFHQLFRATLHFLALRDLIKQPLVIGEEEVKLEKPSEQDIPVLFDAARSTNLLFKMSRCSYCLLRQEAQNTIKMLSSGSQNQFEPTFILKTHEPLLRFDYIFEISMAKVVRSSQEEDVELTCANMIQRMYNILLRGLGSRIKSLDIAQPQPGTWPIDVARTNRVPDDKITISVAVEVENLARTVDRGPPAEESESAQDFRDFWGSKAELRRFKDGSIIESVVWGSTEPSQILREIVSHLLITHFNLRNAQDLQVINLDPHEVMPGFDPNISAFEPTMTAYKTLEKGIRSLDGLPLQVNQIQPSSPALSYSSLYALPLPPRGFFEQPVDFLIKFEGSTRWPDDLRAIQMTKIAFLLKLSDLLQQSNNSLSPQIGVENDHDDVLNKAFLELTHSGIHFRIRIHHDRESTLLQRRLKDKTTAPPDREAAAAALAQHKRLFDRRPLYRQALQIIATRFPALSPAIRLTKKWFHAHMLSAFFADELIETFVVRTFVEPWPWTPPSTAPVGLLRTLLFLSRWSWQSDPLVVDFSAGNSPTTLVGNIKQPDRDEIQTRFAAWRQIDPAMNRVALFVATNFDRDGTTWTEHRPSKLIAGRMRSLAQAASQAVSTKGLYLHLPSIFKPSLKDYDFVLHLKDKFTRAVLVADATKTSKYRNLQQSAKAKTESAVVHGYVGELQDLFGEAATFFYDADGGPAIAGLWNPWAVGERRWKVNLPFSTRAVGRLRGGMGGGHENAAGEVEEDGMDAGEGGGVCLNKEAILHEMVVLGDDMVDSVEVREGRT